MPIHDWSRVDAGVFHHFHQGWIFAITNALNSGGLPEDLYALSEQQGGGFEPDVLTLQTKVHDDPPPQDPLVEQESSPRPSPRRSALLFAEPRMQIKAESPPALHWRKQSVVAIRHVSGDRLVAVVEIMSRGNKSNRRAIDDFVRKAAHLLASGIHLLILDLQPPTARDPHGIHPLIWEEVTGAEQTTLPGKPLTLAAYESATTVRAFVEPVTVGDRLIDMPLFVDAGEYVAVPTEATYEQAFAAVPRRWREVLEAGLIP